MTARATASCSAIADCGPPGACTVTRRLARSARSDRAGQPDERCVLRRRQDRRMEVEVGDDVPLVVVGRSHEIVGEDPQPLGLLVAAAHRRESSRSGLDDQPHFGHVADDVGDRSVIEHPSEHFGVEHVPGHPRERDGADLGSRPQEALRCQHLRRFADHGAGDTEPFAEFGLDRQGTPSGSSPDTMAIPRSVTAWWCSNVRRRGDPADGRIDRSFGLDMVIRRVPAAFVAPSRRGGGAARARAGTDGPPAHPSRGRHRAPVGGSPPHTRPTRPEHRR